MQCTQTGRRGLGGTYGALGDATPMRTAHPPPPQRASPPMRESRWTHLDACSKSGTHARSLTRAPGTQPLCTRKKRPRPLFAHGSPSMGHTLQQGATARSTLSLALWLAQRHAHARVHTTATERLRRAGAAGTAAQAPKAHCTQGGSGRHLERRVRGRRALVSTRCLACGDGALSAHHLACGESLSTVPAPPS